MARVFLSALALVAAASTASAISCGLVVPSNPLTAAGLATPYILTKAPNSNDNCTMSNPLHQVFVNAVVLDFDNNRLLSYTPLVIDEALLPKAEPTVVPALPTNSLVALFIATNFNAFGTINDSIVLLDDPKNTTSSSLYEGNCLPGVVRGGKIDSFLQFATCNSVEFFNKALAMAKAGSLYVPKLLTGNDGLICPTVRSFDLVDSTQSDTVPSSYILLANGVTVQNNDANLQKHKVGNGDNSLIFNESDAALLDSLDEVIGCSSWKIEDLTDPDKKPMVSNFAADELQAALFQPYPVALVPANDPDVLSAFGDRPPNLVKLNTYRAAVGQPPAATLDDAGKEFYCKALLSVGTKRLAAAKDLMTGKDSHDRTMGVDLYTFWAARFLETFSDPQEGLGCKTVLGMPTDPVKCITNSSDTAYPDSCHSVEVTVSDPLGVYSTKAAATTTTTDNNGAVIGLAVSLGVVAIAGAAFIVFIYRRTHGFAALGSGGISLREV